MEKVKTAMRILNKICIAAAILTAAFILAYAVLAPRGFASAQDDAAFVIATSDGRNWTLSENGETIATALGDFFDPMDKNAVSAKFLGEIKARTQQIYTLRFELPPIASAVEGDTSFDYTQTKKGGVLIKGVYSAVISTDITSALQYRKPGGDYEVYPDAYARGDGLVFGQNADIGEYEVRYVIFENFDLDGRVYSAARYSSEIDCTVKRAAVAAPQVPVVEAEYGISAQEISWRIQDATGSWTLSQNQSLPSLTGETLLDASDEAYIVKFDYTPFNENYAPVVGVDVRVKIAPKNLRIYIYDAFALVGEPLENLSFEIYEQLAGDDKIADLGVELFVENGELDTAGEYTISARFSNKNYNPEPLNKNGNMFIEGGKLTLYATKFAVTASDGMQFELFATAGYLNIRARVELLTEEEDIRSFCDFIMNGDTYTLLSAYRFVFEDALGDRVYPDGDYVVTFISVPNGAMYAAPESFLKEEIAEVAQGGSMTIKKTCDKMAFYKLRDRQLPPAVTGRIDRACYALIGLTCACAVVFVVLAGVYFARRRRI